ncbi:MAG: PQQ-binding-like beta-propeller repeat protein [Bacteroidales bacterium]
MKKASPSRVSALICVSILFIATSCSQKQNWPQFRGSDGNMIAPGKSLPETWGNDKNVKWTYEIKGTGWSSPVIWGNRVFITSTFPEKVAPAPQMGPGGPEPEGDDNREPGKNPPQQGPGPRPGQGPGGPMPEDTSYKAEIYRWEVTCVDLGTGKEIWKQTAFHGSPRTAKQPMNTYANETPVTDGKRICAYFGMIGLYCYDMNGKLLWQSDLGSFKTQNGWGAGSSPVLYQDVIYIQVDNEIHSFIVAIDAATGKEKWKADRVEKTNYSTPFIWKNNVRTELVTGGKTIHSYDLNTGKVLWELKAGGEQNVPSPVADNTHLYIGNEGSPQSKSSFYALKAGAAGDITPKDSLNPGAWIEWSAPDAGLGSGSPLLYKGLIYNIGGRGEITVTNSADGKQIFKKRINGMGAVWATPWAFNDKIYFYDEKGVTHVIKAGEPFKQVSENKLNDKFWASVAITGEKIVFRGVEKLWCVGK